jgi:hypothetical protein
MGSPALESCGARSKKIGVMVLGLYALQTIEKRMYFQRDH